MNPTELSELIELQHIIDEGGSLLEHRLVGEVLCNSRPMALHAITLGNPDAQTPAVGFFGGVHGLERIGGPGRAHVLAQPGRAIALG